MTRDPRQDPGHAIRREAPYAATAGTLWAWNTPVAGSRT